ncbi:MAG: hypothetical protein J6I54_00395 [Bacteroidaceae bacterium]|nr:hypothetical protein [Bacteroidaceae bacterium]
MKTRHPLIAILLLIPALSTSAGQYTITFSSQATHTDSQQYYAPKTMVATGISTADPAFGTITCTQTTLCYSGKSGHGMKIGTAQASGTLTLQFSTPVPHVSAVIIDCASYSYPNRSATITLTSGTHHIGTHQTSARHAQFEEASWDDLDIDTLATITLQSDRYSYIRSITIVTRPLFTLHTTVGGQTSTTTVPMTLHHTPGTYTATVPMQMQNTYTCSFLYDGQTYGNEGLTIDSTATGESLEIQSGCATIVPWFNGTYTVTFDVETLGLSVQCTDPTGYDLKVTSAGWATLSLPFAIRLDDDLTAYSVNERNIASSGTTVSLIPIESPDGNIAANTPMAIRGAAGTYTLARADAGTAVTGNLLHNHQSGGNVSAVPGARLYKMAYVDGRVGWYFGKADGAPFPLGRYKAYLALTEEQQSSARSLTFSDMLDHGATRLTDIQSEVRPEGTYKRYDLTGRQVHGNHRGIVIINGQKAMQ